MIEARELYERLRSLPFPALGKEVGDFPLYDALLAGCADRAFRGQRVDAAEVPMPDEETEKQVDLLRKKGRLSEEETTFLAYFDVLERLRLVLQSAPLMPAGQSCGQ